MELLQQQIDKVLELYSSQKTENERLKRQKDELEEKIQRRLRSNQRFLERFMDEDFDDLDDDDIDGSIDEDEPDQLEEL